MVDNYKCSRCGYPRGEHAIVSTFGTIVYICPLAIFDPGPRCEEAREDKLATKLSNLRSQIDELLEELRNV